MRRFVIGDIHGAYKALKQCLERSKFDYEKDLLISLGDICDGWPETAQCIEELLKIENLIVVLGNHDKWALQWMLKDEKPEDWLKQGGQQTLDSYKNHRDLPATHLQLLKNAKLYHLTDDDRLFVHAGIETGLPIEEQDEQTLLWDRTFYNHIKDYLNRDQGINFSGYKEVYIGHSPIHRIGFYEPKRIGEVYLMDTGAAWEGTLSIMDIDTKKKYISDKPIEMYPEGSGRS